jgi:hypothetical protein
LSLAKVCRLLNAVGSSDRRIGSLATKRGHPAGSAARNRADENDTDKACDHSPAEITASFISGRKH